MAGKHLKKINNWIFLLLVVGACLQMSCAKKKASSPILISQEMNPAYDAAPVKKIAGFLQDPELKKIYINDGINRFFPKPIFLGRVKYGGISHQAVFCTHKSRFGWIIQPNKDTVLHFGVFIAKENVLMFSLYQKINRQKKLIWQKKISGKGIQSLSIPLEKYKKKDLNLLFETTGHGIGAWLNPVIGQKLKSPKNIFVVVLDTLRADHLSLYGYPRDTTPALSDLAKGSTLFSRAYSTSSWTLPAHVSLFSGQDVSVHGVVAPDHRIKAETLLLAEFLQQKGFVTAAFTGGGFVDDSYGFHRGFQFYNNFPGQVFHIDSAGQVLDRFKHFHKKFHQQNCFIFLHTYQLHTPYKAPHPYCAHFNSDLSSVGLNLSGVAKYLRLPRELFKEISKQGQQRLLDLYDGSILYIDQILVKGLIEYLKKENLYENSTIVVLSDHGEEFYDHNGWEHGHSLYRELIHIPLIIKFPRQTRPEIRDDLTSIKDIPYFILQALGLENRYFTKSIPPLFQSLPKTSTIPNLPARFSVINGSTHYIRSLLPEKTADFFQPPPLISEVEVFDLSKDEKEKNRLSLPAQEMTTFEQWLKKEVARLHKNKSRQQKLSDDTINQLKQLGYF